MATDTTPPGLFPAIHDALRDPGKYAERQRILAAGYAEPQPQHEARAVLEAVRPFLAKPAEPQTGTALIAAERERQIAEEGRTPEHDASHVRGEMARAAACYALAATAPVWATRLETGIWPAGWEYKPDADVRMLAKAGALIAAEIDRLLSEPAALGQRDGKAVQG